jgi:hypothetical protein
VGPGTRPFSRTSPPATEVCWREATRAKPGPLVLVPTVSSGEDDSRSTFLELSPLGGNSSPWRPLDGLACGGPALGGRLLGPGRPLLYATAVYWSTTQLLTYGSSLSDPVTHGGRILEIMMDVYGLVVIGTLTASIGAYFIGRTQQQFIEAEQNEILGEGVQAIPNQAG